MAEPGGVVVEEVQTVDEELVSAIAALVPQLSRSAPPPTAAELQAIVDSPATVFFAARDEGAIVGSLTLVIFRVPTGVRAWIEDVVVDGSIRGKGIGAALVNAAIAHAGTCGARTVDLTSRPSRGDANRLYQRLGFEQRTTNVYRWSESS